MSFLSCNKRISYHQIFQIVKFRFSLCLAFRFIIAVAANRFIFCHFAQQNSFVAFNKTMRNISQSSTAYANGMYFIHIFGHGTQSRHRTEWNSTEIHVETSHDNSYALIGQLAANIYQILMKTLTTSWLKLMNTSKEYRKVFHSILGGGEIITTIYRDW